MKKVTLDFPNEMAIFLKKHKMNTREEMVAYAMFLFPFIYDQKLTFGQAASMMGLSEENLRSIYDNYEVNEKAANEWKFFDALKEAYA